MRKIRYEEYVTHVDKRLKRYNHNNLYRYAFKYAFMKRGKSSIDALNLFRRYMDHEIFIKWDIEDENG